MKELPVELLQELARLAVNMSTEEFDYYYKVQGGNNPFYRNITYRELMCGFNIYERKSEKPKGVAINIMNNGDIFGRTIPYYDGDLNNLVLVYNQRDIINLLKANRFLK